MPKGQRGAALAYVIALVAVLSILVGYTWRSIRFNNELVSNLTSETEARMLSLSGIDYALSKIGYSVTKQNLNYSTEGLNYHVEGDHLTFNLEVHSKGLFARATSTGKTFLPKNGKAVTTYSLLGEELDIGKLPALTLLNHEGNLVLAGTAEVTGPILLWRGDVRKATDYNVRWSGTVAHTGRVLDSTSKIWNQLIPNFERAEEWMKNQSIIFSTRDFKNDFDYDSSKVKNLFLPDSGLLVDTVISNTRIFSKNKLRIGTGAVLSNCKLIAANVFVTPGSTLRNCIVYADRNLSVTGGELSGGQYLASDSLFFSNNTPIQHFPVFYVEGRTIKSGHPDSSLIGSMILEKASGEAIFFGAFLNKPNFDQEIRVNVKSTVNLTGLIYANSYAKMEGNLQGSFICQNLKFEYKGTIWVGHLKDAHLKSFSGSKVVAGPLVFPGFTPIAMSESK